MTAPVLERISRELALRKRLQEALLAFSRGVSARLALTTGLGALATEINGLFGTARTSIWLHDRRARVLALAASSDPRDDSLSERISTTDEGAIARGLRQDGVHVTGAGAARTVVAPLRGWRRALGTLVIEGPAGEVDDQQLIELSVDLARQLSTAVESVVVLEELIRQHRLLEDTFDSLAEMVVVTDAKQRAVQINHSLASRVGAARADLIDRPLEEVVGGTIAAWLSSPDGGARSEVASREFGGEQLAETLAATATPLVSQEGGPAGRVLVLRDITDQVQMRARLAQSEKLASLGQFIAGVAHEMNNPLQGVLGHLELMIAAAADSPRRTDLRRIYNDAERAAKIVRNLLVFAGSQRSARRRVNIEKLVARVIATREGAFHRPAVEIVHERHGEVRDVMGDAGLLQQALLNVVINSEQAIAQSGKKGRITVTTGLHGRQVRITVADTGAGIPAEVLPRIFDPFFTTKEVGQGTGLGLAIVYGVIQEHGGTITAANAPGGGALFSIDLPQAE